MFQHPRLHQSSAAAGSPAVRFPANKGTHGATQFLIRVRMKIAREPAELLALLRAGRTSDVSLRCALDSTIAVGFAFAWSGLMIIPVLIGTIGLTEVFGESAAQVLVTPMMLAYVLPALLAALVVVVCTLLGFFVGLVGLFVSTGRRLLCAVGLVLNAGVLGFSALLTLFAAAL